MQRYLSLGLCLLLVFVLADAGRAHFGMILPEKSMMMQGDKPEMEVILSFNHPFEQKGMVLAKPRAFGVQTGKQKTDLLSTLVETKVLDNPAWKGTYIVKKPGIYAFYFDPPTLLGAGGR
jgi:cobalt/nickel transport protein